MFAMGTARTTTVFRDETDDFHDDIWDFVIFVDIFVIFRNKIRGSSPTREEIDRWSTMGLGTMGM
jgi:hypothetical protein